MVEMVQVFLDLVLASACVPFFLSFFVFFSFFFFGFFFLLTVFPIDGQISHAANVAGWLLEVYDVPMYFIPNPLALSNFQHQHDIPHRTLHLN